MKNSKTIKLELTPKEYSVLTTIASLVEDCMEWDKDYCAYIDGSRFIYSCDKYEMAALKRLCKRI